MQRKQLVTIKREKILQKLVRKIKAKSFPYETKEKKKIDWSNYDRAQSREIVNVINLIRELVEEAYHRIKKHKTKRKKVGRPQQVDSRDVAKVLLLQTYLELSNRMTESFSILFSDRLGLKSEFSYKTIERGYDHEEVDKILVEVFRLTNKPIQGLEKISSIDGTGYPTSVMDNYNKYMQSIKAGKEAKSHGFIFNIGVIWTEFKIYSSWIASANSKIAEPFRFQESLEETVENNPGVEVLVGDGSYAARYVCQATKDLGIRPIFMPKKNMRMKSRGCYEWVRMLSFLIDNPHEFLRYYHTRSISESGFSMDKRFFGKPVRKRLKNRKEKVSYLRAICHNIRRLAYLLYLSKIDIFSKIVT